MATGGVIHVGMEGTCMELALEGERLCKAGDCRTGVQFFEAAVQVGTDDLKTLSAIYSQLGNAYFYLQEYGKALEYHKHDLNLARTIGDRLGEAKASGNLGNTLKVLSKFEEAIVCCQRHLDISRELKDRIGEARALYNLGNVYHAQGKHRGRNANQDPGEFPPDVKEALQKAADFYEQNLVIVRELGDRAAQGRACGNLGNTHYLLGNFGHAIKYHEERLAIAKEFGDKSAERRAYSNLGNAHIFLGQFEVAVDHYKKTLQIAKQLSDLALEAQACYSMGNTYTLLRDYDLAIEYHIKHLQIAQQLNDKIGEGRACWSLGNAHTALGNHEKALQYATRHLELSREIGDSTGQLTAEMNLTDLKNILGINKSSADQDNLKGSKDRKAIDVAEDSPDLGIRRPPRVRRKSMEEMKIMKLTPDKREKKLSGSRSKQHKMQKAASVACEAPSKRQSSAKDKARNIAAEEFVEDDGFFELLTRFQSRRIDDQRCSFRGTDHVAQGDEDHVAENSHEDKENTQPSKLAQTAQAEEFLDMVAGIQGSRMNDQRADLPEFPGLVNQQAVIGPYVSRRRDDQLQDQFFEMLMRCQGSRIDDQRSELPEKLAPTVPDEDFFNLIQRAQSNRLDEQRSRAPAGGGDSVVGFEMMFYSFGSGFHFESDNATYISETADLVKYALKLGIEVGGYDLISLTRKVEKQWMAQGASRPSACFASGWYDYLLHRILTFMDQTGMSALESDGPYSGYSCHSTNHAHHDGLHDSVYKQNQLQAEFFEIMVKRGVFINQPDHYFYHGGCKTGMGYNEHQYSLPRWQDLSVSRQGMFDDTFAFTPTVGWMHVPLVQYHGGGAAAAFEPLSDHLPEYEWALAQYLGAGVAAAYRGHRLYDSDKAKAIVTKWVAFYNRHRPILSSDIIHVRRADMQDIDCLLHVNPYLGTRGLAMVFNPTAHEVTTWLSLPLYYTGLETVARVAVQDGEPRDYTLNRDYSIDVPLVMPPGNITWITVA